jgi:hypothetical protein
MSRYTFDEVRSALRDYWGLSLHRGGEMGDGQHDGRWDTCYSKTGYVVGGQLPRRGHGHQRHPSLADVVASWGLAKDIARDRASRSRS